MTVRKSLHQSHQRTVPELESTHIPAGFYVSKSQAAKFLGIEKTTLQHHIKQDHLPTINFPGLGHLILKWDILRFEKNMESAGRPSIYSKK